MQNERVVWPWKLLPSLQMENREARQCVVGLGFLLVSPKRVINEAVRVKSKLECRLQDVGDAKNVRHLLSKATSSE
jgi:hypothetical protein